MKDKENQEHVTRNLVVWTKENTWLPLLDGEDTCPEAGRKQEGGG